MVNGDGDFFDNLCTKPGAGDTGSFLALEDFR